MLDDGVLDSIYNPLLKEELESLDPRSKTEEEKLTRLKTAKPLYKKIIKTLNDAISNKVYKKKNDFLKIFVPLFKKLPPQYQKLKEAKKQDLQEKIAFALSEMDKTAEIQKDKQGNAIYDSTTKDTELVKLNMNVEEYFKIEVYPHVPDARYVYEYGEEGKLPLFPSKQSAVSLSKEKIGAEFPFTRYFYEYKEPERADVLLKRFMELERLITQRIKGLSESIGGL
jgi:type I restriction enzyme M protein